SFAGIATGLTGSWATVRISRCADGKFVWPEGLPRKITPQTLTVAANVLAYGTGALNIDACRVGETGATKRSGDSTRLSPSGAFTTGHAIAEVAAGRFPSNVLLDESQAAELDAQSGTQRDGVAVNRNRTDDGSNYNASSYRITKTTREDQGYGGGGGASRFFPTFRYEAKAPGSERPEVGGVAHATVKPLDLMRWLVRLVTRRGGHVLDPFAGSGTTGEAALLEGMSSTLIELEESHLPLILQRVRKPLQPSMFGDGDFPI
ncbi:DNA methyltransferase, partial [Microbacterium gubbeenense]|uniref:DNA methyltransferase n=1 Tax=Microbacterium gubbeenense TaxID=159896 RepID=UPI003F988573